MKNIFYIAWRIFVASVVTFTVTTFVIGVGGAAGRGAGLEDGHNMGEVLLAFVAGALVTLLYRDRIDDREDKKRREHGS